MVIKSGPINSCSCSYSSLPLDILNTRHRQPLEIRIASPSCPLILHRTSRFVTSPDSQSSNHLRSRTMSRNNKLPFHTTKQQRPASIQELLKARAAGEWAVEEFGRTWKECRQDDSLLLLKSLAEWTRHKSYFQSIRNLFSVILWSSRSLMVHGTDVSLNGRCPSWIVVPLLCVHWVCCFSSYIGTNFYWCCPSESNVSVSALLDWNESHQTNKCETSSEIRSASPFVVAVKAPKCLWASSQPANQPPIVQSTYLATKKGGDHSTRKTGQPSATKDTSRETEILLLFMTLIHRPSRLANFSGCIQQQREDERSADIIRWRCLH